ncbi:MAG: hypothetical protein ACI8P9_002005 [Parasphingorhabdus sp.]|jgi:hypothetical protein
MFEYMMQSIAYAGGVAMAPGETIMPPREVQYRHPGIVRRSFARALKWLGGRFISWSSRLIVPKPVPNMANCFN